MTSRNSQAFPNCYIALPVSFAVDAAARAAVPTTSAEAPISWFEDGQLHLTLCYLGWLTEPTLDILLACLTVPSARPQGVDLTGELLVVGTETARSLIAPVAATPELHHLRRWAEEAVRGAGLHAPPFEPHVTLGRVGPGPLDGEPWSIEALTADVGPPELREGRVTWAALP